MRQLRWTIVSLLGLLLAAGQGTPAPAGAQERQLFRETGWRVQGQILRFWQASGGLPVFGFPLSAERMETTPDGRFSLQRFERGRLELHPEKRAPYQIELGRLGADLLGRAGRDWRSERGDQLLDGACEQFPTGREVCGPFLDYWRSHGLDLGDSEVSYRESLALFGLPLTPTQLETNSSGDRVVTQWFERARFEHHPRNPLAYRVLLGRLGAELYGEPTPLPRPSVSFGAGSAILQGHTFQVTAELKGSTTIGGRAGNVALPFVRNGSSWRAIGAVSALQPPGRLEVIVEAELPDGRVASAVEALSVREAGYQTEYITLPPDVTRRLEENAVELERENVRVRAIWPVVSPEKLWQERFALPAQGRFASVFGTRRSYNGEPVASFHEGLDIANSSGTAIVAAARGRVVLAEPDMIARGGAVILDHGWGVHTGYWHMEQLLVAVGDMVQQGQLIGRMGARGMVTGPHLHWELHIGATSADPLEWTERSWP